LKKTSLNFLGEAFFMLKSLFFHKNIVILQRIMQPKTSMTKSLFIKFSFILLLLSIFTSSKAQEDVREFFVYDASNGMAANGAQTIKCTKTGRMVITTIGHVNFYDGHHFSHIVPMRSDMYPLPGYDGNYRLMFDRHHHLWLKDREQVVCVDLLTETVNHNPAKVFRELGINKPVEDLFADHNSMLWLHVGYELLSTDYNLTLPVRKESDLHDIDVYGDKYVLLFYDDGFVICYDLKTGKHVFDVISSDVSTLKSSVVYPYNKGFFQICNQEEGGAVLRYLDIEKRQWGQVLKVPYTLNNMTDNKGKLYVASAWGYWVYDLQTNEMQHVEELKLSKDRKIRTDVNVIEFDRQGGMWLGTENRGLLYAKPFTSPFHVYSWDQPESRHYFELMFEKLPKKMMPYQRHVNCVYTDSRGWKWTGTYSGLKLQRNAEDKGQIFMRKDGLMNEMVHSVVEDKKHDIWASTSFGISHLYINKDSVYRIESYIHRDNVPVEAFINGFAALLDDGNIVMQSMEHMVVFNPEKIHELNTEEFILYPKLVALQVNGQDVKAGELYDGHMVTDRAVTRTKDINVNYDQNTLLLTFSGLNYFRPMQTYYRVRVKGTRNYNEWRLLSNEKTPEYVDRYGMLHLSFTNLKPGNYAVELQTSILPDADNWEQDVYQWNIIVHEPWWRTTAIYLFLLFLVVVLLVANLVLYGRNMKMKMVRNNEEYDILQRIKTFAYRCANMSKEILSPYSIQTNNLSQAGDYGMSTDFMESMLKIVPYITGLKDNQNCSIRDMADLVGKSSSELYDLLAANLDKNPRTLIGLLRLTEAAELLKNTDKSVEEIANECNFISPNYFIASFYHRYRQTPADYRNSNAL